MAAFVGNAACVAAINNHVDPAAVGYFARRQPLEDRPKLKPELAKPLHGLVMSVRFWRIFWHFFVFKIIL